MSGPGTKRLRPAVGSTYRAELEGPRNTGDSTTGPMPAECDLPLAVA